MLSSHLWLSSNWSLSLRSPYQNPVFISALSHTCHMPRPSYYSWFDHLNTIWWEERNILKFHLSNFLTADICKIIFCALNHQKGTKFRHFPATTIYYSVHHFPGGKGGRCVRLTTLPPSCAVVMKSGNLYFLEPSGSFQACNGSALPTSSIPIRFIRKRWNGWVNGGSGGAAQGCNIGGVGKINTLNEKIYFRRSKHFKLLK
jgi:hypothetical protein